VSLRLKLLLAQTPLVVALAIMGVAGSSTTAALGDAAGSILKDNYRSVLAAQRMNEALERMDSGALFIVTGEHERGARQIVERAARFDDELQVQEGNITEAGEREATARLRAAWEAYQPTVVRMGGSREAYFTQVLPAFQRVKEAADEILALNQDAMVRKRDAAESSARRARALYIGLTLAGLLLGVLTSSWLTTRLLRPLGVLSQAARRIGEGDLAVRAGIGGSDEIAGVAREFNAMADRLRQYRQSSLGELLEAQQASQAAIDSLPDPVVVLAIDGQLLNLNRAAETLLRLSVERAGSMSALEPTAREVIERVRLHVVGGRGAFQPHGLEEAFRMATPDGERHFLPRATPLYAEGGAVSGVTVVLQDVTRLLRFDELKNNLVATVAHEFRTPLTSLRMAIHLCAEESVGPLTEKQADLLHAAREDCERLQTTVDELLDLSRIQAGRIELATQPMDIEALVDAAIDAGATAAAEREVKVKSEVLPDSGAVVADPDRVALILANLIGNAVRYSPAGGEVTVGAEPSDGAVRFTVADKGPGIPREYQPIIFDRFVRVAGDGRSGAGLGLFIARELVLAHGGEIGVESEPGHGSRFWFTLPRA